MQNVLGKNGLEMRHLLGTLQTVAPQVDARAMSSSAAGEGVCWSSFTVIGGQVTMGGPAP